jgi:hypothetical protein
MVLELVNVGIVGWAVLAAFGAPLSVANLVGFDSEA